MRLGSRKSKAIVRHYAATITAALVRAAIHNARALRRWLNSRHEYGNEEGSITLTGWQYLGMGALTIAAMLLLSIRF